MKYLFPTIAVIYVLVVFVLIPVANKLSALVAELGV